VRAGTCLGKSSAGRKGAREKDGKEEPGLKPKIPAYALRAALKGGAPPTEVGGFHRGARFGKRALHEPE